MSIILLVHIVIALSGIAVAAAAWYRPGGGILGISASLTLLTLASGTYLVISRHRPLLSACLSGLAYLTVVGAANFAAARRLKKAWSPVNDRR